MPAPRAITGRHGDNRWRQELSAPFDGDAALVMMNAVRAIHSVQSTAHRLIHKVSRPLLFSAAMTSFIAALAHVNDLNVLKSVKDIC